MCLSAKPLVFDLFCGLGGWSESFIAEGYRAVGFDIERHNYGNGGYPGELVLRDVRSITGAEIVSQYGIPACIVASPPCQEFSYMAMPWTKAKEKMRKILADPQEQSRLTELFNQCFRIQREVSEAAGHYVPLIIENVRGAQRWVGKARWNFGSFYLWGDVPALMPIPARAPLKHNPDGTSHGVGSWFAIADSKVRGKSGLKLPGNNSPKRWDEREVQRLCDAVKMPSESGRRTDVGKGARFTSRDCGNEGTKQFKDFHDSPVAALGSKSKARKQASAEIAKIPPALAQWIAKCFKPTHKTLALSPQMKEKGI